MNIDDEVCGDEGDVNNCWGNGVDKIMMSRRFGSDKWSKVRLNDE